MIFFNPFILKIVSLFFFVFSVDLQNWYGGGGERGGGWEFKEEDGAFKKK